MVKNSYLFCLLALLISCSACETDLSTGEEVISSQPDGEATAPSGTTDALSFRALDLVNQTRRAGCKCGSQRMPPVSPVSLHPQLTAAARTHSADQARIQKMQHQGSDGSTVGTRLTRAGYSWRAVAENVAWNYPNIDAVVAGWISSPGHCRNIMNPDYTFMGVAEKDLYWTQVFAK